MHNATVYFVQAVVLLWYCYIQFTWCCGASTLVTPVLSHFSFIKYTLSLSLTSTITLDCF